MCQGFSHLSVFLHHFVMAILATSSIRVNGNLGSCFPFHSTAFKYISYSLVSFPLYEESPNPFLPGDFTLFSFGLVILLEITLEISIS